VLTKRFAFCSFNLVSIRKIGSLDLLIFFFEVTWIKNTLKHQTRSINKFTLFQSMNDCITFIY
jgi:hypothetical protein